MVEYGEVQYRDSTGGAYDMPVHDWTRVDAGLFHDFHQSG